MKYRFEKFTSNITKLYRVIQKLKEIEVKDYGLKSQHVMIIYYLARNEDGLTSKELKELCDEDKAAISRSVKFLEEKGLISIEKQNKNKSYRSPITLTEEGLEVSNLINQKIQNAVERGGSGLSEEERLNFYNALILISNNLNDYTNEKE